MPDGRASATLALLGRNRRRQGLALHAELLVRHAPIQSTQLKEWLSSKFQAENRAAIAESALFGSGEWNAEILFATKTPAYRLLCLPSQDEELQIYVEPVKGNVLAVCESIWGGTKAALAGASPELASLELVDSESNRDFLAASSTTFIDELKRRETLTPILVAVAVVFYAFVGAATFASDNPETFLAGAVSGGAAALVAVAYAALAAKRGRLVWQ